MTKSELINRLRTRFGWAVHEDADECVNVILAALSDAMVAGDRVEIRHFGVFFSSHRDARTGRNPKTGASVEVPPRRVPRFRASRQLLSTVDKKVSPLGTSEPR